MSNKILVDMNGLLLLIADRIKRNEDHATICRICADQYELWQRCDCGYGFPIWLSRIVEGEMRDATE